MDRTLLTAALRVLRPRGRRTSPCAPAAAALEGQTAASASASGGDRPASLPLLATSLVTLFMTLCAALLVLAPPAACAEALPAPSSASPTTTTTTTTTAAAAAAANPSATRPGAAVARAPSTGTDASSTATRLADSLEQRVQALAEQASQAALRQAGRPGARVAIEVGQLDPRLRLGPCAQVQPYLPPGARLWGRTRIGLRCAEGARRWNVYLPITVKVFAPALTVAGAMPAGAVIGQADLRLAEVDLAAAAGAALVDPAQALGRALARPLAAGQALRRTDLRSRLWFAAGEPVRIRAMGNGYAVSGEGQALSPGLEGQRVRVRTESGRIVSGVAVAERQVEVAL